MNIQAEKALKLRPNFNNYNLLAWILIKGDIDIDQGINLAQKALQNKPENLSEVIKLYPYLRSPEHSLGLAYLKKGEYKTAQNYLEEATAFAPNSIELKNDLIFARKETE